VPIRQRQPPTEEFVAEFQESIIPSAIPNELFIDFDRMEGEIDKYEAQIETVADLRGVSETRFTTALADALMNAEDTREWIDFYFELVGERGHTYSSAEGSWKFYDIQRAIDDGNRDKAEELAGVLQEVGLQYIVDESEDIRDHYRGMLVGMESHKRKNRQGTAFEQLVKERVAEVVDRLRENGFTASYEEEYVTEYEDETGQSKRVDFALFEDGALRLTVEANAYKTGGSKPSEIRRSYNHVGDRMYADGVAFTWITDGQGWDGPLDNVLRQSYEDIVDIYNLHMMEADWYDDVITFFETGEV
jgi:flavin-binding protein dodecin